MSSEILFLFIVFFAALCLYYRHKVQELTSARQAQDLQLFAARRDLTITQSDAQSARLRLNAMVEEAFDGLIIVNAQHRIVMMNPAARTMFHLKPTEEAASEFGNKIVLEQTVMAASRSHELDDLIDEAFTADELLDTQITIYDRELRAKALRISSQGKAENISTSDEIAVVLHDVSELVRLTRARRDMVANFSHDLGTPIATIRLIVDTLQMNYGRNPERDKAKLLELAGTTDSLQHMTRELIDLATIESGRAIIRMVELSLESLMRGALDLMLTQAEQKNIEIITSLPDGVKVLADPGQTQRVLTNLIHNALKFTPSGGRILISAICDDTMVTIRIKDTGMGIPPQDRVRIFERFYQVDTARTQAARGGGTGLGLSIAKHIVEAQGGRIWAEPGIPNGAILCFTLPLSG